MSIAIKKKEASAKGVKLPSKTYVNLAQKESKKKNILTIVGGIAVILAVSGSVAKFGVIDQLARLDAAQAAYDKAHERYVQMQANLENYPAVEKKYRTYSRSWMENTEENGLVSVDRADVLDLMEQYLRSVGTVNNVSVTGTTMVVNMSGMTLTEISAMFDKVEQQPIVASAALNVASTEKEDYNALLDFTLTIQLRPAPKEETNE